ncbi:unnamed protein product [Caenorhabditis angaria]|uniref:Uncharacterized protein n=1 Tax=Caenorhabditis angaria TaxID=860376 RepID=A0A9P1I9U3_9PELO|nr:unnamed protein product [Caenorhabditis angaria]
MDGFDDCLDGSDENQETSKSISDENSRFFENPVQVLEHGVLTPTTLRYGRGECQHRWTVISPNGKDFVMKIIWHNPSFPNQLQIQIEGTNLSENQILKISPKNQTSLIFLPFSSFILTASGSDTRKKEFEIHFAELKDDPEKCHVESGTGIFSLETSEITKNCDFWYEKEENEDFLAILMLENESSENYLSYESENFEIHKNRLLVLPTRKIRIHVKSTWPSEEKRNLVKLQIFPINSEIFIKSRNFEIFWLTGAIGELAVNMLEIGGNWDFRNLRFFNNQSFVDFLSVNLTKSVERNQDQFQFQTSGPTKLKIHGNLSFNATYSFHVARDDLLSEQTLISVSPTPISPSPDFDSKKCKLPTIINGYVENLSSDGENYAPGTNLTIFCNIGFYDLNLNSGQNYTIATCQDDLSWSTFGSLDYFECSEIECPAQTPAEILYNLTPINSEFPRKFEAVRNYSNWSNLPFSPFCVCGNLAEWECFNMDNRSLTRACFTPEFDDGIFEPLENEQTENWNTFAVNQTARLTCHFCPKNQTIFQCTQSLPNSPPEWLEFSTGKPIPKVLCDCVGDPVQEMCGNHGKIRRNGSIYTCDCDDGYRMVDQQCVDIDECAEKISLCDPTSTCINQPGSFECSCEKSQKIYNSSQELFSNIRWLIANFSCVEKVCNSSSQILPNYSEITLKYPKNFREIYKDQEGTGKIFAVDLCGPKCVVPFDYFCENEQFLVDRDVRNHCLNNLDDLILEGEESYNNNWPTIFSTARVRCKNEQYFELIGRPEIFCNSTFQWDILPICAPRTCPNITNFIESPLQFSSVSDENILAPNSTIVFNCASGFSLLGLKNITCSAETLTWNLENVEDLPICVPIVTVSPGSLENSMVFEEVDLFDVDWKTKWIWTNDWEWHNNCITHRWHQKISFFTLNRPIEIFSPELDTEIVLDIAPKCSAQVILSIFSTDVLLTQPPSLSHYREVLKTRKSGSLVVKLTDVKRYLYISVSSSNFDGPATICSIKVRRQICGNSRKKFSKYCGCCVNFLQDPPAISKCGLNDCSNGNCVNLEDGKGFYCVCHENFISTGKSCIPDNCPYTNQQRSNGYNCKSGVENDPTQTCGIPQQSGKFCQFSGILWNSSYFWYLDWFNQQNFAYSINSCCSDEMKVIGCEEDQGISVTPTSMDPCSMCNWENTANCTRDAPYAGSVVCGCKDGYYGRFCDVSTFCLSISGTYNCLNGGTCQESTKSCKCPNGWTGEFCELQTSYASCPLKSSSFCQNGVCEVGPNGVNYCNCDVGFLRDSQGICTIQNVACELNNPCQQNSSCELEDNGNYNCGCQGAWKGDYCQIAPTHDCEVCSEGHSLGCVSEIPESVECKCAVGYKGEICNEPIDDCIFTPCFNSGTCSRFNYAKNGQQFETYNCTCPAGFSGTNCEIRATRNCEDLIRCENGGTCDFDSNGQPICKCTQQFYGEFCEKNCFDVCAHATGCTQNNNTGQVWCECQNGFTSQYCDVVDNVCITNILTCQNGGTCQFSNQTCSCLPEFSGDFCEIDSDLCRSLNIQCENGGTCQNSTGICTCPSGFYGDFCENLVDFCHDYSCFNGGICEDGGCFCQPGTTGTFCQDLGQPCKIQQPNGTITDYCQNGGKCFELANGAACDCGSTEFTGRRCETRITFNFNLVFNGLQYTPPIISNVFSNSSAREFTICSFVQYNYPKDYSGMNFPNLAPFLAMRSFVDGENSRQIVFDNFGFHMCDDQKSCVLDVGDSGKEQSDFKKVPITPNTWHHFCLVSPSANEVSPIYTGYLDGVKVVEQYADRFIPKSYGYLILAPQDLAPKTALFQGMISMTQMYIIRLNETQIGKLAFDCYETLKNGEANGFGAENLEILKWQSNFTRVSSNNPGVYTDPAGICGSVKCMFGRQFSKISTGCEKDRIPPSVSKCPTQTISILTPSTRQKYTTVTWREDQIAFFDNIGIVRITSNYVNGQQFAIGIHTVRYVAFDAAGNSATCEFRIVVANRKCPTNVVAANANIEFVPIASDSEYSQEVALVNCEDPQYCDADSPRFYVCDLLGNFEAGGDVASDKYYLPGCGKTTTARQIVNGTIVSTDGESCEQVSAKLRQILWTSIDCDAAMCRLRILPPCGNSDRFEAVESIALQYELETQQSYISLAPIVLQNLRQNFQLVRQTSQTSCNSTHPILQNISNSNSTFCISCPPGTSAQNDTCQECPQNTYRSGNDTESECQKCPNGTVTLSTGSINISECYQNCPIGQFFDISSSVCQFCPIGSYGNSEGLKDSCISCDSDLSTSSIGSKSVEDCAVTCEKGYEMVDNICQPCVIGFYKNQTRGPCLQCPRGLTTTRTASDDIGNCDILDCLDLNTYRNTNLSEPIPYTTPYSFLCPCCEQGTFQNLTNQDTCLSCSDLNEDDEDVPLTCQSTCSPSTPLAGCNCQLQTGSKLRNCLVEVHDSPSHASAIAIVLPIVFGVLLVIIATIAYCLRRQIYAWCRKSERNDNQNVRPGIWNENQNDNNNYHDNYGAEIHAENQPENARHIAHIPRPNLRIVTNRAELDQLPPLPLSSSLSFPKPEVDSFQRRVHILTNGNAKNNSSTRVERRKSSDDDESSLDSFF